MLRDFRHSLRALLRAPGFAAVAVLTIAIGIGANTAVFSVVNSVLLKPLPYPHAEQLIALWHKAPGAGGLASVSGDLRPSASMYVTYSEQNHSFQSIGIWSAGTVSVTGIAEPEQVPGVFVSDGVLEALDMPPAAGRWLTPADQKPGAPATILLGYGYWQRRFAGDPSAIGRKIMVNSRPREIVGVMPRGFRIVNADADLIAPLAIDRSKLILPGFGFQAVARLKPGITIAAANADIARLIPIWMDSWPTLPGINPHVYDNWRISPAIRPLKQDVVGSIGNILWVVMGTIGIVMLIACVNVANLLLVRAEARQQELAVRAALGAGWGRIVRELLVESVTLGFIGGVLGIAIAQQGLRLLIAAGPANLPRLQEISLDARALAFTAALALLSGFLFGLIPALRYAGPRAPLAIHGGARAGVTRERRRTRNLLVVAQVALAMVLLVSSGLMIRTFQALRQVQPGFVQPEQIQLVRITIPQSLVPDAERTLRTENDIVDKLAAIPGVQSVAFETQVPMENIPPNWDVMVPEGRSFTSTEIPPIRYFQGASPGIFHTMGSRMIAGREYNWTDLYGRRPVVIVS